MPDAAVHNVTDATLRDFYKRAVSAKQEVEEMAELTKAANGRYRAILKAAKAAGIDPDDITDTVKVRHMDRADLIAKERSRARMMAVVGIWPKIQVELFAQHAPVSEATAEDAADVAYDRGHHCGVKGELRTINPYNAGTEQWAEFDRGWSVGQEKNVPGKGRLKGKGKGKANLKVVGEEEPETPPDAPVPPLFN
jgi:hypothetical protein